MKNKPYLLALNHLHQVGPRTILFLLKKWPRLEECFKLKVIALVEQGVPQRIAEQIQDFNWKKIENDLAFEEKTGQTIVTWDDTAYPALLKEIHAPPPVLYARGNLTCLQSPMLAMVGTRYPTPQGRKIAFDWAQDLSQSGLTIVSGLARGIDTAAHEGCLQGSKKTVAVLGSGMNTIYPASNRQLARKITEQGVLLSEFPIDFPPKAGHFPRRNRIISGLSRATLIVEAALKSGSLITSRFALEQNRDVFALPGSIYSPQSQGCNHILKQGASLVTNYRDVLIELGMTYQSDASPQTMGNQHKDRVLDCLDMRPSHVDTIMAQSGLQLNEVISRLAELELSGQVISVPGGYTRVF